MSIRHRCFNIRFSRVMFELHANNIACNTILHYVAIIVSCVASGIKITKQFDASITAVNRVSRALGLFCFGEFLHNNFLLNFMC